MNNIVTTEQAATVSKKLHDTGKTIVLVGGCFDILHIGHIRFLSHAKEKGDVLMIMLEHDDTIKRKKGKHRPLNTQKDRAEMLTNLSLVDYVITLPAVVSDDFYNKLVNLLKPAIIATTTGDPFREHKERQAKQIGATVVDVIKPVTNQSTTKVITFLNEL